MLGAALLRLLLLPLIYLGVRPRLVPGGGGNALLLACVAALALSNGGPRMLKGSALDRQR